MWYFFNIIFAGLGLAVTTPIIAVSAIFILRDSSGGVIFAQDRVGRFGKVFRCYKLRTMTKGAPNTASHLVSESHVTRSGKVMRKYKIDELPQLWNVLRGDMNLVGPRPCLPSQIELCAARKRLGVLSVRPGITGLAQIEGIDMSDPERLASRDADYLRIRTPMLDLKLILQTAMGSGSGDRVNKQEN